MKEIHAAVEVAVVRVKVRAASAVAMTAVVRLLRGEVVLANAVAAVVADKARVKDKARIARVVPVPVLVARAVVVASLVKADKVQAQAVFPVTNAKAAAAGLPSVGVIVIAVEIVAAAVADVLSVVKAKAMGKGISMMRLPTFPV